MENRREYQARLESQLSRWRAEIDKLKARADEANADARIEYYRQLDQLREQQASAQNSLDELRNASEGAWRDLTGGVERAWNELGESVRSAASHFK